MHPYVLLAYCRPLNTKMFCTVTFRSVSITVHTVGLHSAGAAERAHWLSQGEQQQGNDGEDMDAILVKANS